MDGAHPSDSTIPTFDHKPISIVMYVYTSPVGPIEKLIVARKRFEHFKPRQFPVRSASLAAHDDSSY